uniref:Uncharacterized protein n=1 Tax=Meloidogyne enterolobii TaxID=390850 RepID=A0A6V7UA96_MELEN|nr:unnamed protein product [Meloidogyne enterolobii]
MLNIYFISILFLLVLHSFVIGGKRKRPEGNFEPKPHIGETSRVKNENPQNIQQNKDMKKQLNDLLILVNDHKIQNLKMREKIQELVNIILIKTKNSF